MLAWKRSLGYLSFSFIRDRRNLSVYHVELLKGTLSLASETRCSTVTLVPQRAHCNNSKP
eukprot:CCRYP_002356-RA/>CCRYP_002356-RA protein AED:0.00 eAED:0.00 QI:556/1/1/1/1/1/2/586/59